MTDWISTDTKWPDFWQRVLVYEPRGDPEIYFASVDNEDWWQPEPPHSTEWIDADDGVITHWMPITAPNAAASNAEGCDE